MTREEYIAKLKANKENLIADEGEYAELREVSQAQKVQVANRVIKYLTSLIEKGDLDQEWILDRGSEEELWLHGNEVFLEKLEELRKKYDFLEIFYSLAVPGNSGFQWRLKEEVKNND